MAKKDLYDLSTQNVPNFLKEPEQEWFKDIDDVLAIMIRKIMEERGLGITEWLRGTNFYYDHVLPDMGRGKKSSDKSNLKDALNKDRLSFNTFTKALFIIACASEDDISVEFMVRLRNETDPKDSTEHSVILPSINKPRRRRPTKKK